MKNPRKTPKMSQKQWDALIQKVVDAVVAPEGFTKTLKEENYYGSWGTPEKTWPVLRLEKPDDTKIEIVFSREPGDYFLASGHTGFKSDRGWLTFDRRGVDDSFYLYNPRKWEKDEENPVTTVNQTIQEQLKRIAQSRDVAARSTPIPGLERFSVTPERKASIIADLKAGRSATFAPAGFGTGYRIFTRRSQYSSPAPKKMADFFEVPILYMDTFDHD